MLRPIVLFTGTLALAAFLVVAQRGATDEPDLRLRFDRFDRDGDGRVTAAELGQPALFRRLDENGDGAVTWAETERAARAGRLGDADNGRGEQAPEAQPAAVAAPNAFTDEVRQGPRPLGANAARVGELIADVVFTDLDGVRHRLGETGGAEATALILTGTSCPLTQKYAPTLAAIEERYAARGVRFVFVNPTASEPVARLREAVATQGLDGPYVHDTDKRLAAALGAGTTTEAFVLDAARTLVYRGAVDDRYGFGYALEAPRRTYLTDALDAVLAGRPPAVPATTAPGCALFYDDAVAPPDAPSAAGTVAYHNRVSRIVQANCLECHRGGGGAPIAFETYEEVRDYAGMIGSVVERGVMPPWFAAPLPGQSPDRPHWANDRSLSARDKADLLAWIEAGAPEGDPADAPLPKTFPGGWLIGEPDATFAFPEPVPVQAEGVMPYRNVTVETNLGEDRWVRAIEIRPGEPGVVHHVIVSLRGGDGEIDERDGYWGVYVPGNSTLEYPDGYARLLPKGATLRFQMHYTPNGTATEDLTRIGLVFADGPPEHEVKVAGIANARLRIPAGAENHRETASLRLPHDVDVLGFLPHMHLRGKAARYDVETADGGVETLLDVPRYDFNWQLLYRLAEPRRLHAGDVIRFDAWFDNSAGNPANPDPTRVVTWGPQTEDEMHLGYVEYVVPGAVPGESTGSLRGGR
ncbi:redoxin family protein [Alienimonas chondri]|nr:redoxin family protein [Alienimonas chondri]